MVSSRPGMNCSIRSSSSYLRGLRAAPDAISRLFFHDVNADGRSLPRRFDDDTAAESSAAGRARMTSQCGVVTPCSLKLLLRANFVEGEPALLHAFPGVGDAAVFQNLLHLAVFAEGAVEGDEGELDVVRQSEVRILARRLP